MRALITILIIYGASCQITPIYFPKVYIWDDDQINIPLNILFRGQNLTFEAPISDGTIADKYTIKQFVPNDTQLIPGEYPLYISPTSNYTVIIFSSKFNLYYMRYLLTNKKYTYSVLQMCNLTNLTSCYHTPIYEGTLVHFICKFINGSSVTLTLNTNTYECKALTVYNSGLYTSNHTIICITKASVLFINDATVSTYLFNSNSESASLVFSKNITYKKYSTTTIVQAIAIDDNDLVMATNDRQLCIYSQMECFEISLNTLGLMYYDSVERRIIGTINNTNHVAEITYSAMYLAFSYEVYDYEYLYYYITAKQIVASRSYIVGIYLKTTIAKVEECFIRIIYRFSSSYQNIHSDIFMGNNNCSALALTLIDYSNDLLMVYNNGTLFALDILEPIFKLSNESQASRVISIKASNKNYMIVNQFDIQFVGGSYYLSPNAFFSDNFDARILGNFPFQFNINSLFVGRLYYTEAQSDCFDIAMCKQVLYLNTIPINIDGINVSTSIYELNDVYYYGVSYIDNNDQIMRTDYFFTNTTNITQEKKVLSKNTTSPMDSINSIITDGHITAMLSYSSLFGGNQYLYVYTEECQNYVLILIIPGKPYSQVIVDADSFNIFLISSMNSTTNIDYFAMPPFRFLSLTLIKSYSIDFQSYFNYMKLNSTNYIAFLGINSTGGLLKTAIPEYVGDDYFTEEKFQEGLKGSLLMKKKIVLFYVKNITIIENFNSLTLHYPIHNSILTNDHGVVLAVTAFDENYFIILTTDIIIGHCYYALYQIKNSLNSKLLYFYDLTEYINKSEVQAIYIEELTNQYAHLHIIEKKKVHQFKLLINEIATVTLTCNDKFEQLNEISFEAADIVNNKANTTLAIHTLYFEQITPHIYNFTRIAFTDSNYTNVSMCSIFEGYSLNFYLNVTNNPSYYVEPTFNFTKSFSQSEPITYMFSQNEYINVMYSNGTYSKYKHNEIVGGLIKVNSTDFQCSSSMLAELNGVVYILCTNTLLIYDNGNKIANLEINFEVKQIYPFTLNDIPYFALLCNNNDDEEPYIYVYRQYSSSISFEVRRSILYKLGDIELRYPSSISSITESRECFLVSYENYGILSIGILRDDTFCSYFSTNLKLAYSYNGELHTELLVVNSSILYLSTNYGIYYSYTIPYFRGNVSQTPRQSNETITSMLITNNFLGVLAKSVNGLRLYVYKLLNRSYLIPQYEYLLNDDSSDDSLYYGLISFSNKIICYFTKGSEISQLIINLCPSFLTTTNLNQSLMIQAQSTYSGYSDVLALDIKCIKKSILPLILWICIPSFVLLALIIIIVIIRKIRKKSKIEVSDIEALFLKGRKLSDPLSTVIIYNDKND